MWCKKRKWNGVEFKKKKKEARVNELSFHFDSVEAVTAASPIKIILRLWMRNISTSKRGPQAVPVAPHTPTHTHAEESRQ